MSQPLQSHLRLTLTPWRHSRQRFEDAAADALAGPSAFVFCSADRRRWIVGGGQPCVFGHQDSLERLLEALAHAEVVRAPGTEHHHPVGVWGTSFFGRVSQSPHWAGFPSAAGLVFSRTHFADNHGGFEQIVESAPTVSELDEPSPAPVPGSGRPYVDLVAEAVDAIDRHELDKVVLARSAEVSLPAEPLPLCVLGDLIDAHPDAAVFVFKWAGALFFGATPERLVAVSRGRVETMALAGSHPVSDPGSHGTADLDAEAAALMGDAKERAEHAFVVESICAALADAVDLDTVAQAPAVVRARNILHLRTPISGQIRPGIGPAELVRLLHPTAALGGTPRAAAMRFIETHEGDLRGWYGSPLGFVDASGNLEFAVTLRSALVRGRTAVLYAGAGIVRGSQPVRELAETEAKLTAMRELLRRLEHG